MKKIDFENFIHIKSIECEDYPERKTILGKDIWFEPRVPIGFQFGRTELVEQKTEKNISLNFFDSIVIFPIELQNIVKEIEGSSYIPDLKDNWDNMGALKIEKNLYIDAVQFLIDYSLAVYNVHNIVIDAPEINPCLNGTIDMSWRSSSVRLLINFKRINNATKALFYRDHYKNEKSNKGELALDVIDESFLTWMKLLK